jgi:hypothetical protein
MSTPHTFSEGRGLVDVHCATCAKRTVATRHAILADQEAWITLHDEGWRARTARGWRARMTVRLGTVMVCSVGCVPEKADA